MSNDPKNYSACRLHIIILEQCCVVSTRRAHGKRTKLYQIDFWVVFRPFSTQVYVISTFSLPVLFLQNPRRDLSVINILSSILLDMTVKTWICGARIGLSPIGQRRRPNKFIYWWHRADGPFLPYILCSMPKHN